MDNQLCHQNKAYKKEVKKMERVGKYYGVCLIDAIKFTWLDATFAVERKIDKLHRNRVKRATLETNVATEAAAYVNHEPLVTTATENGMQDASATDELQKKPWECLC